MYTNTMLLTTLRDQCHILSLNGFTQQGVVESGFSPSPSDTKGHYFSHHTTLLSEIKGTAAVRQNPPICCDQLWELCHGLDIG